MPTATPLLPHLLHAVLHLPVLMSLHFKPSDNDSTLIQTLKTLTHPLYLWHFLSPFWPRCRIWLTPWVSVAHWHTFLLKIAFRLLWLAGEPNPGWYILAVLILTLLRLFLTWMHYWWKCCLKVREEPLFSCFLVFRNPGPSKFFSLYLQVTPSAKLCFL